MSILKAVKLLINFIMTIILVIGIIFIILYVIGIKPFVVVSGSMEPVVEKGSISFINEHVKYSEIRVNDIIAYSAPTGDKVTHRVINITEDGFETKGDANDVPDGFYTTEENFIGKNVFSIPKVGYGIKQIQTPKGKIVLVTTIIVILLGSFLIDDKKR